MADWRANVSAAGGGKKIVLQEGSTAIDFGTLLQLWSGEPKFADWYSALLLAEGGAACFWEHPPLTKAMLGAPAEFMLLPAGTLAGMPPDPHTFAECFATAEHRIAVFDSLGRDARLLAPCPERPGANYAHLTAFIAEAPQQQVRELWRQTALELSDLLDDKPLWLSTSGLGVAWLHIRLDSRPKYYQHVPYKEFYR